MAAYGLLSRSLPHVLATLLQPISPQFFSSERTPRYRAFIPSYSTIMVFHLRNRSFTEINRAREISKRWLSDFFPTALVALCSPHPLHDSCRLSDHCPLQIITLELHFPCPFLVPWAFRFTKVRWLSPLASDRILVSLALAFSPRLRALGVGVLSLEISISLLSHLSPWSNLPLSLHEETTQSHVSRYKPLP